MILVLAEHRRGELRDVTFEMLTKAKSLSESTGSEVVAVILGKDIDGLASQLARCTDRVLVVKDERLENFVSDKYQEVLSGIIADNKPSLFLIAHTSFGMELAPFLAAKMDLPLVVNCIELEMSDNGIVANKQIYGGKLNCRGSFKGNQLIATFRPGIIHINVKEDARGEITEIPCIFKRSGSGKKFLEYIEQPAGEVDVTKADIIVSVGRGIKNKEDIKLAEDLARCLGGVVACSRPITDKRWLSQDRQVGTSGKTVNAKLYIALGISGAYQHLAGIASCNIIIAINEDPYAPILSMADYAIINDLYKIVPAITQKLQQRMK